MIYSKDQRTTQNKAQPADGWHTMKIVKEMPNPKQATMHTFLLDSPTASMFWNVFLRELDAVGGVIGVVPDGSGAIDTAHFVGKTIRVQVGDRFSKDGKAFKNVLNFTAAPNGATQGKHEAETTEALDIPF